MTAYADGYVVTEGMIRGDTYTFLIASKTSLLVSGPDAEFDAPQRGVPIFFILVPLATVVGLILDQSGAVFILPLLAIAFMALVALVKSFFGKREANWRLFLGSTEPVLIYSSVDYNDFENKRREIERALLGRPLSEEE